MDTTLELAIGQVVKSKSGRDKNRNFIVIGIVDDEYVLLADGNLRKWDKPKKKKVKHLAKYNMISNEIKTRIENHKELSDAQLRQELEKLGLN